MRTRSNPVVGSVLAGVLVLAASARGQAQDAGSPGTQSVQEAPLTCWWRTSTGAIRVGEPFSLVLTCAVVDTDAVKVVPDESRLDARSMQLPPFDILSGTRGADIREDQRRFLQYQYTLRLIADDQFGKDVKLPTTAVTYRVRSRTADGTVSEGKDLSYELPARSIRVLSLVPNDASDIREGSARTFQDIDSQLLRGNMLRLVGLILFGVAALAAVAALLSLVRRNRVTRHPSEAHLPPWLVRRGVAQELVAIQQERARTGWSHDLAARALAALRVVAAYALSRHVRQAPAPRRWSGGDGGLVVHAGWPRPKPVLVSGSVTAQTVAMARQYEGEADADAGRLRLLEELEVALASLTAAKYGRDKAPGNASADAALDDAVATGLAQLRGLTIPQLRIRRLFGGPVASEPETGSWLR